jgi:hypothetical protein
MSIILKIIGQIEYTFIIEFYYNTNEEIEKKKDVGFFVQIIYN